MYKFKDFRELVELRKLALENGDSNLIAQYDKLLKDNFYVDFKKYFILSISDFTSKFNEFRTDRTQAQGVYSIDEEGYYNIKDGRFMYSDCELRIRDEKGLKRWLLPLYDNDKQLIQIPLFVENDKINEQWSKLLNNNPKVIGVLWKIVRENFLNINNNCKMIQKMIENNKKYIQALQDDYTTEKIIIKTQIANDKLQDELNDLKK